MAQTDWTLYTKSKGSFTVDYVDPPPPGIGRGGTTKITLKSDSYSLLNDLIEYAGSYSTLEGLNGEVFYSETVPSSAEIDSLVVGLEPNQDLQDKSVFGIWGIIDSATDERPQALTTNRISLSLVVLAKYSDYADHTSLENDLQLTI